MPIRINVTTLHKKQEQRFKAYVKSTYRPMSAYIKMLILNDLARLDKEAKSESSVLDESNRAHEGSD